MSARLHLRTYRYGEAPAKELRIGTTRRPPRGVPREKWRAEGWFDVWFPLLAPSEKLLRKTRAHGLATAAQYRAFCAGYEREILGRAETRQALELLALLARRIPIAIGCYCEDESRCHRAHLYLMIVRAAAAL